jgi:hypothetical protein
VTSAADLILGLGDPVREIIQLDFQSNAAAWKHADLMVYHSLLFAHYHVPVHTVIVLLRPEAAHTNLNGAVVYAPRPGRGKMEFSYEIVRLWQRPAEQLLAADLGVTPLAMLGRLPAGLSLEDGLTAVAQRIAERLTKGTTGPPEKVADRSSPSDRAAREARRRSKGFSRNSCHARIRHLSNDSR